MAAPTGLSRVCQKRSESSMGWALGAVSQGREMA